MKSYNQVMGIPRKEEYIGMGEDAIRNTVSKMKDIIIQSSRNPYIRSWAKDIVANVEVNNKEGEARAIHNFVRDHVRYTRDPYGFEYIQTPPVLLEDIRLFLDGNGERPIGDCDDMTVLSLSLLKSIGFPVAIKVVSFHNHGKFSHVYGLVQIYEQWVPIDCVRPDKTLGWESDMLTRVMETIV
jgi:hypothetical protein